MGDPHGENLISPGALSANGGGPHSDDTEPVHRVVLTAASAIRTRRVKWLWDIRIPLGTFALLAGREGLGKSTFAYWLVARITRGDLPGEHHGRPRAVLVCATEDSWEHTIVPRLIAAGADLERVFRVEVIAADHIHVGLSLPRDLDEVEQAVTQTGAALLLLDPLMSRISARLDANKDGEVRRALEPLATLADRTSATILGIIHLNKTGSTDILDRVMSSKAFVAVARAVCAVVPDPDDADGTRRLFGVPKNNLGRTDLASVRFTIGTAHVDTDDGETSPVGRIVLDGESATTIAEAMERNSDDPDVRTARADCMQWLTDYLTENSHADSRDVKDAGKKAGHSESTINRARKALHVVVTNLSETPRRTVWSLARAHARGDEITDMTDINAGQGDSGGQADTTSRANRASDSRGTREVTPLDSEQNGSTP